MAIFVYELDGGGPKDSKNTLNSFLTRRDNDVFGQIGADMLLFVPIAGHDLGRICRSELSRCQAQLITKCF